MSESNNMSIAPELLRRIIEGALLAAAQPLSEDKLLSLIDEGERPEKAALRQVLEEIAENCAERGFELKQVASGWRFQVPEDLAPWVNKLWEEKPQKYSRATLETLAIIAYRQPITRGDIEEIRGVAVSSHIVKSLSERGWIKVVGQRDVPGKPSLYATTREFLDYFNLKSLDDLPTLAEIRDIESLNAALDLGDGAPAPAEGATSTDSDTDGTGEAAEATSPAQDTAESADDAGDEGEAAAEATRDPDGVEPVEEGEPPAAAAEEPADPAVPHREITDSGGDQDYPEEAPVPEEGEWSAEQEDAPVQAGKEDVAANEAPHDEQEEDEQQSPENLHP
ncbi:SMC-Scp complex subunit ScpB [Microbulbifer elongatus]|uniref:SMC-Scp complex subunit ScpB n=1 Tax=Microbulbifer elongatus TaxID=86173 RepID=UPI001E554AD5|nr:SMC-Scp complex subunit ScpB [Microbulbifer elongatus]